MSEIYFAPTKGTPKLTPEKLQERFRAAGLTCEVEPESEDSLWIVFSPHETTLYISRDAEHVGLATLNIGPEDDPKILGIIEQVMDEAGFSADEEASYE